MKRTRQCSSSSDTVSAAVRLRMAIFGTAIFALSQSIDGVLANPAALQLAYLDPGSGSFMIQALVAALAGIAVTVRTYWSKIQSFLGLGSSAPDIEDSDSPTDDG